MTTTLPTLKLSALTPDPTYDILRTEHQPLHAIFHPQTVAVIGASEKPSSVGRTLLWNLIQNPFGGTVYPVNPKRASIRGIKAYPDIATVPDPVDLAIIATPAKTVPQVVRDCAAAGVKGAIVISAGFKEIGAAGVALEAEVLEAARAGGIRLIGPNCLGVMNPHHGLNATFASTMAQPGNVGFISQSGALCTSILDWSFRENVGFSAFISIGSMLDVGWGDLIDYLGDDPHTESIVIYMESIGNARSFLSAAREVALSKPIIVIKAGRTAAAAQAATSHTGALTGSDEVLDAAFRRCGVLRVETIDDLFNMAEILAKEPRPKGRKLTIVTNAGGPGVLATDALIRGGGELAPLSTDIKTQLDGCLPAAWSGANPIDILGDADPQRYADAVKVAAQNPDSDGLLVILTPQAMTNPDAIAAQLAPYRALHKPLLASWMGGSAVNDGEVALNKAGIFTFPFPDTAAQVFNLMGQYTYNLASLYETPDPLIPEQVNQDQATDLLKAVQNMGRTLLTEWEAKQVLAAYGIPTVPTHIAQTVAEAIAQAHDLGYPVALKLHSYTITHKTDAGGVKLNLSDADAVADAFQAIQSAVSAVDFAGVTVQPMVNLSQGYELIIGSSLDPQFGPVLVFGLGGQMVEVFRDRAIALPPLNTTLARRMMEQTKIYTALQGVRGRAAVNLPQLEKLLVRFSHLVVEHPEIKEIDINPLLANPGVENSLQALDARIVLHPSGNPLPQPAIRPYPSQYSTPWRLVTGLPATIRPICPEDEPLVAQFHQTLSAESVYLRYFHMMKLSSRIRHERLTRICFIDYDREMAIVADYEHPQTGEHEILGIARLSKLHGCNRGEFAMLVSDNAQGRGLGTELLRQLIRIAQAENLESIEAEMLFENRAMQHVSHKLGFEISQSMDGVVKAILPLA
ncbi:MAG: bifunctional acetate--CoA ligase family protein/GNAT family N-acetyltransferase [Spirulina sp. SIO3F2]|nr:bifunctional acetate--CoA ligase family protein/GNAT family N-acetyltransferase [Spirulina sp. SIO3F2]